MTYLATQGMPWPGDNAPPGQIGQVGPEKSTKSVLQMVIRKAPIGATVASLQEVEQEASLQRVAAKLLSSTLFRKTLTSARVLSLTGSG